MKRLRWAALVCALALGLTACGGGARVAATREVVVSAAASLTDALNDAAAAFMTEHPEIHLRFNFGSSGALAHQIEQGAPVDLFISAAPAAMVGLREKGLVAGGDVSTLATNTVVLVRSQAATGITGWDSLRGDGVQRIALGDPSHVPAGEYGRQTLTKLGLYDAVAGRLVLAGDVRQVLNYVKSGEAQAGIVYRTDAAVATRVVVVAEAPPGSHAPVEYPMAVLKEAPNREQAAAFAAFLRSDQGRAILKKYGFGIGE
jgi:molybdate transport system substrate-binding protein